MFWLGCFIYDFLSPMSFVQKICTDSLFLYTVCNNVTTFQSQVYETDHVVYIMRLMLHIYIFVYACTFMGP